MKVIRRKTALALMIAGMMLSSGCGRSRQGITLAGSTAFQPFAEKLADMYMETHPGVSVTVHGGGSAMGIYAADVGVAHIGMADLVRLPKEADGMEHMVVARDGIAIALNPANAVNGLTMEQVRGIFSGTIKNWREVGGVDRAISVISREAGSGTRSSFEQIIEARALAPDALIQDSNGTIRETVANDPYAIGYLSHGLINDRIKPVPVDGFRCEEKDIADGNYKLIRPVFLVYKPDIPPACKAFLEYLLTPEAQELLHKNGLIRVK
jgi:phosphate transport system substrate-binding protein